MERKLRIVTADDEASILKMYQKMLAQIGHEVVGAARTGQELVELCSQLSPDLVITDIKMPDMDGIDAAATIYNKQPVPIILVSGYHDPELIDRAAAEHVLAYLVKPIEIASLEAEIAIAVGRFNEFQALTKEAAHYRQALSDRKVIERAKGILMRKTGLPEPDAFQRLQKLASSNNKKLVDIAGMIVLAEEALTS